MSNDRRSLDRDDVKKAFIVIRSIYKLGYDLKNETYSVSLGEGINRLGDALKALFNSKLIDIATEEIRKEIED